MHYPDFANPDLLERIPLTAKTILDVGCGGGALGAEYLQRNPACRVLGIEIDPKAAVQAKERGIEIFSGDVEEYPMPFDVQGGIDCIIYGDVLEHLADPWAVLKAHAQHLSPEGSVVVCMPNLEHWSFAARLLLGQFEYQDMGLFDRSHLRWFTPRTMAQALTDAGLEIADATPRPIDTEKAEQFAAAMTPALQALGVQPEEYLRRSTPLQIVWRARKSAPERLELTATMLAPQGGVSDVRVLEPLRALRTDSSIYASVAAEQAIQPLLPDAPRIAVLHRPLLIGESGLNRIRALLEKNYVIISEFDDHPKFMEERGVDLTGLLTFRGVHAVQTSTPVLAESLAQENPEIAVFSNGIFDLPPVHNFENLDQLTLLFCALNRQNDWAPYMTVLNEVAKVAGDRLRFRVIYDEAFFNALESEHKSFEPAIVDYATYMRELSAADINFMPLEDNEFNRAKSDLKFIEAGAARVVALASPVVYAGSLQDGRTGVLFRDAAELRASLLRILAYPEAARGIADAARAYVAQHRMLAYQVSARTDWYRSLWARRTELNEALKQRVPELFA